MNAKITMPHIRAPMVPVPPLFRAPSTWMARAARLPWGEPRRAVAKFIRQAAGRYGEALRQGEAAASAVEKELRRQYRTLRQFVSIPGWLEPVLGTGIPIEGDPGVTGGLVGSIVDAVADNRTNEVIELAERHIGQEPVGVQGVAQNLADSIEALRTEGPDIEHQIVDRGIDVAQDALRVLRRQNLAQLITALGAIKGRIKHLGEHERGQVVLREFDDLIAGLRLLQDP